MTDFSDVKALAFDYFGTIGNKLALASVVDQHFPGKGAGFTKLWFATIQRYCFQNGMMERYTPWEDLTKAAFKLAAFELDMDVPDDLRNELIAADEKLPVYDDAHKGLSRLAGKYQLYVLSMGSPWMIRKSQENSAIAGYFVDIVTTQEAAVYKPGRRAYQVGVKAIGLLPDQIGFVSGNSFDVLGSKNFGFPTIWVRRYGQPLDDLGLEPDLIVGDLEAMADALEC
ncbi:MAG: haloacid dehalogenase type II [Anderseniella sp.]